MGLVLFLLYDPGTEVPGYYHGVPPGRIQNCHSLGRVPMTYGTKENA